MAGDLTSGNDRIGTTKWGDLLRIAPSYGRGAALALAIVSVAWFAFSGKALFLKYPPVWPDEADFANPAINLLQHGRMSTDLLDGALPGMGQRTYWMPPLYFLYVAAVFRFTGPGIVPLRLASLALSPVVLGLTYLLALRTGLGRWLSLLPVSLIAIDSVFLRGALVGRMDMLALALALLSLWLAAKSFENAIPWKHSLLTGIVCALAALTHPVEAVAPISVTLSRLLWSDTRTRRSLLPLLAGILIPFLPWLVYILQDPASFAGQFGGQLVRKSSNSSLRFLIDSFFSDMAQYTFQYGHPRDGFWAFLFLLVGSIGLGYAAYRTPHPRQRPLLLLFICQSVIFLVVGISKEMWYPFYLIPLTAIGVAHLLARTAFFGPFRLNWIAFAALALLCVVGFAGVNIGHVSNMNYLENAAYSEETDYSAWCARISRKIPPNSRVMLSIVPDPYLGLLGRSDLSFRKFLPARIPIQHDAYWRYLSQADYIVVGVEGVVNRSPSAAVEEFVKSNATLVETVGNDVNNGYCARIYRVNKPSLAAP